VAGGFDLAPLRGELIGASLVEASIAAAFFLWDTWVIFSATSDPEEWEAIAPATLSSRFSKFHK